MQSFLLFKHLVIPLDPTHIHAPCAYRRYRGSPITLPPASCEITEVGPRLGMEAEAGSTAATAIDAASGAISPRALSATRAATPTARPPSGAAL